MLMDAAADATAATAPATEGTEGTEGNGEAPAAPQETGTPTDRAGCACFSCVR